MAQLSNRAKSLIENPQVTKCLSVVSFFEMAVKIKIGKLPAFRSVNQSFTDAKKEGFSILSLSEKHLAAYNQVPLLSDHRDPFDRMLIATAIAESLTIITIDQKFELYKNLINVEW